MTEYQNDPPVKSFLFRWLVFPLWGFRYLSRVPCTCSESSDPCPRHG
jgi:hypothetical protein